MAGQIDAGTVVVRIVADHGQFDRGMYNVTAHAHASSAALVGVGRSAQFAGTGVAHAGRYANSTALRFQQLGVTVERTAWRFQRAGFAATVGLTAPILGIGAAALSVVKDFQHSTARITGLVGVNRDVVAGWRDDMEDISRTFGIGMNALAESMYFVTTSGFRGEQALSILTTAAKGAAGGLGEIKDIAWLLTAAINAYGGENLTAARAADVLTEAVRLGRFEANELAKTMGRLMPISVKLGVSFEESAALLAGLSRTGTKASEAVVQLRRIMFALIKPAKQARDELKELALTEDDLEQFEGALSNVGLTFDTLRQNVEQQGLFNTLQLMRDAFDGQVDSLGRLFPRLRAFIGVLDLLGENEEENIRILNEMSDSTGVLSHAFARMSETVGFSMNQMKAEIEIAMLKIGESILPTFSGVIVPVIETAAEVLGRMADAFKNLPDVMQVAVTGFLGLAAALGPVIFMMSQVLFLSQGLYSAVGLFGNFVGLGSVGAAAAAMSGIGGAAGGVRAGTDISKMLATASKFEAGEAADMLQFGEGHYESIEQRRRITARSAMLTGRGMANPAALIGLTAAPAAGTYGAGVLAGHQREVQRLTAASAAVNTATRSLASRLGSIALRFGALGLVVGGVGLGIAALTGALKKQQEVYSEFVPLIEADIKQMQRQMEGRTVQQNERVPVHTEAQTRTYLLSLWTAQIEELEGLAEQSYGVAGKRMRAEHHEEMRRLQGKIGTLRTLMMVEIFEAEIEAIDSYHEASVKYVDTQKAALSEAQQKWQEAWEKETADRLQAMYADEVLDYFAMYDAEVDADRLRRRQQGRQSIFSNELPAWQVMQEMEDFSEHIRIGNDALKKAASDKAWDDLLLQIQTEAEARRLNNEAARYAQTTHDAMYMQAILDEAARPPTYGDLLARERDANTEKFNEMVDGIYNNIVSGNLDKASTQIAGLVETWTDFKRFQPYINELLSIYLSAVTEAEANKAAAAAEAAKGLQGLGTWDATLSDAFDERQRALGVLDDIDARLAGENLDDELRSELEGLRAAWQSIFDEADGFVQSLIAVTTSSSKVLLGIQTQLALQKKDLEKEGGGPYVPAYQRTYFNPEAQRIRDEIEQINRDTDWGDVGASNEAMREIEHLRAILQDLERKEQEERNKLIRSEENMRRLLDTTTSESTRDVAAVEQGLRPSGVIGSQGFATVVNHINFYFGDILGPEDAVEKTKEGLEQLVENATIKNIFVGAP